MFFLITFRLRINQRLEDLTWDILHAKNMFYHWAMVLSSRSPLEVLSDIVKPSLSIQIYDRMKSCSWSHPCNVGEHGVRHCGIYAACHLPHYKWCGGGTALPGFYFPLGSHRTAKVMVIALSPNDGPTRAEWPAGASRKTHALWPGYVAMFLYKEIQIIITSKILPLHQGCVKQSIIGREMRLFQYGLVLTSTNVLCYYSTYAFLPQFFYILTTKPAG